MIILGINDAHDASACLIRNGKLVFAIQEERLTRIKNMGGFPFCASHERCGGKPINIGSSGGDCGGRLTDVSENAFVSTSQPIRIQLIHVLLPS